MALNFLAEVVPVSRDSQGGDAGSLLLNCFVSHACIILCFVGIACLQFGIYLNLHLTRYQSDESKSQTTFKI